MELEYFYPQILTKIFTNQMQKKIMLWQQDMFQAEKKNIDRQVDGKT
jgi:hypothetical protein